MNIDPADMFKALAVETRVKIIELLKSEGPLGAKKIAELVGITPAAVSQHLRILRQVGFVRSERNGYWIPYSIDVKAMEDCRITLNEICQCGCQGTCRIEESSTFDLSSLMKYEKELEKELKEVRNRISDIKSKKAD